MELLEMEGFVASLDSTHAFPSLYLTTIDSKDYVVKMMSKWVQFPLDKFKKLQTFAFWFLLV